MLWILLNCLCLFYVFFFRSFHLLFSWEWFLCVFILLNFLCLYESRWNRYLLWYWKGACEGTSLYKLCVPHACGERARFNTDTSNIFPSVQTAIPLVGGGARDRCQSWHLIWWGLPVCSAAFPGLSDLGSKPKLMAQKPWWPGLSCLCYLEVCFFSPCMGHLSQCHLSMGHLSQRSEEASEACVGSLLMLVSKFQQPASAGTCDSAWTHPWGVSFLCSS